MSNFTIDTKELKRLEMSLGKTERRFKKVTSLLFKRIGTLVQGLARKYCPESPTVGMYARMNKSGKTKRKRTSITTGSLRDSITVETDSKKAVIFVPLNSRGGKYAKKIHDEKGKSWKVRGPRTKQKGAKADEKFISRAYNDTQQEQSKIIDQVIDDIMNRIGI